MRKRIEIGLLIVLAGVLAYYVYQRIGIRMGGLASSIQSDFASEEAWMVDTVVRDIAETAAYAHGVSLESVDVDVDLDRGDPNALELPSIHVDVTLGNVVSSRRTIQLAHSFWTTDNYVELAGELLGPGAPADPESGNAEILETLLEPLTQVLAEESSRISARLATEMRDPSAHEEAALLLGVLGLREAAYGFDDKRFLLLRMTSHLSIARALRQGEGSSTVGRVAESTLLALSGRQTELLETFEGFPPGADVWANVLYMYSFEDWRRPAPSGELLVQLARFRAMVGSLGASTSIDRMADAVQSELPDWGRILAWNEANSVAARPFVTTQLGRDFAEIDELARIFKLDVASPKALAQALNQRAERCIGAEGPQVLGWGLWAEFLQRHVMGAVAAQNRLLRGGLAMPEAAESFGRQAERIFSGLKLNPIVQVRRSRYVGGRVEDTVGMDEAIILAGRYPELVNPTNWHSLEDTASHMMRKHGMPSSEKWLSPVVLVTGVLDSTSHRVEIFERSIDMDAALDRMVAIAPAHPYVSNNAFARSKRQGKSYEELSAQLGERIEFDMGALRRLRDAAEGEDGPLDVVTRMCDVDANECGELGRRLVSLERFDDAVVAYERMVAEASSAVGICNNAAWLTGYYFENGRQRDALELGDYLEGVFCSWGLRTKAYLMERMGRIDEAERLYLADSERYDYDGPVASPLLGFYYRRARVEGDSAFEERLERLLTQVFPDGLEPLPETMGAAAPSRGVFIDGDSRRLERSGLRGGDVIVGLDGWQVQSIEQYDAILELKPSPSLVADMQIRVWRQTQYHDVAAQVRLRRLDVRMRSLGATSASYQQR